MKTGRPRTFDEEKTLDRVMNSFWRHGFEEATFEQLVADSGLSRSSLYNSFGGKDELFEKAIELYIEKQFDQFRARLEDDTHGGETIRKFTELFGKPYNPSTKDCLLRKTALHNAGSTAPKESKRMGGYLNTLWQALVRAMSSIKRKKPKPLTNEERGAILVAALFGSAVISRNGCNTALLKAIQEGSAKLIEQSD